jgi:acetyl-CoA carboxylase carboxyltransferase component
MSWQPELDELRRRQEMNRRMGGADKVKRQHDGGRLTVRERIDRLVDKDSFREIGSVTGKAQYDGKNDLVELTPANAVMGRAKIDGRPVAVTGDDFTVRGGSADATIREKDIFIERYANQYRVPLIRIIEGSGGGGSVKTIETTGRANVPEVKGFEWVVRNMGTVPTVGLGLGSVAGLGAARLAATHYSVMVKDVSAMFVAGPPVVNRLSPRQFDKQELGGWEIQLRAGAVDEAADSEDEAFALARRFLSYLPSSVYGVADRGPITDDPARREESLLEAIPRDIRKVYRIRPIVEKIVDQGSLFEMGKLYGRPVMTAFARIDGWPVAVMASDPMFYGGGWTSEACQKVARFVDLAETFHLPVVYFCDCPGFLIGLEAEKSGVIRQGVRAMSAMFQTTVPWCTFIIRNAFGVAGAAHQNGARLNWRYGWPSGRWGSLPLEGGIEAAYRADLDAAPDRNAKMEEIGDRLNKLRSPFRSAESFWIEEIIDPRDTRKILCDFVELAAPVRGTGMANHWMRP